MNEYQKKLNYYQNQFVFFSSKTNILKKIGAGISIGAGVTSAGLLGYNKGWAQGNIEGENKGQELIQNYRNKLTETGNISNELRNLLVNNRKNLTDDKFNEYYDRIMEEERKMDEAIHKDNAAPDLETLTDAYNSFNDIKIDLMNDIS